MKVRRSTPYRSKRFDAGVKCVRQHIGFPARLLPRQSERGRSAEDNIVGQMQEIDDLLERVRAVPLVGGCTT